MYNTPSAVAAAAAKVVRHNISEVAATVSKTVGVSSACCCARRQVSTVCRQLPAASPTTTPLGWQRLIALIAYMYNDPQAAFE